MHARAGKNSKQIPLTKLQAPPANACGGLWTLELDELRAGKFFVTTSEILLRELTVGGKPSGETLTPRAGKRPEVRLTLEWTFPLRCAEVISGDGQRI